jgi:hypothetical protein
VGGGVYVEWESEEERWLLLRYDALHRAARGMNMDFVC